MSAGKSYNQYILVPSLLLREQLNNRNTTLRKKIKNSKGKVEKTNIEYFV